MFSSPYPTGDEVIAELGDKFLAALVAAVRGARGDLAEMREWKPGWFPNMHSRTLSNLIHDRIWDRLVTLIDSDPDATVYDEGATREISIGVHIRLRIKRHRVGDKISTYPTPGATAFWQQDTQYALVGLEEVRIAVGYRWDTETREVGAPVVSLRDGTDNVIWAVELDEPADGVAVKWTPIDPTLPTIDLASELGDDDESGASGTQ